MAYYFCNPCAEKIGVPTNDATVDSHDCAICKKPYCSYCHQVGELYPYLKKYMVHKQCIFCNECKTIGNSPLVKTEVKTTGSIFSYVHSYDNFHVTDEHITHIACKKCERCDEGGNIRGNINRYGTDDEHMFLHKSCLTCNMCKWSFGFSSDNVVIKSGKVYHKYCLVCLQCNLEHYPKYVQGYIKFKDTFYFKTKFNKYFNNTYSISDEYINLYKFENKNHTFYMDRTCVPKCDKCGMSCKEGDIKIKYQFNKLVMVHCSCIKQIQSKCKICNILIQKGDDFVGELSNDDIYVLRNEVYHKKCVPLCELCKHPAICVADRGIDLDVYHEKYVHTHCLLKKAKTLLATDKDFVERIMNT